MARPPENENPRGAEADRGGSCLGLTGVHSARKGNMLYTQAIPAPTAGVYTNGQAPAGKTAKVGTGQADSVKQRRALRKLLRDLVCFAGVAAADLASAPRKTPQRNRERLLYRNTNSLTDTDIDRLVGEIGAARLMAALDQLPSPRTPLAEREAVSPSVNRRRSPLSAL